ncbi:hypothetical protein I3760_15G142000 [Carya illinoinensis]|nr:hypothetical protein I3760_15G142000 [Carya illinoinensis]
MNKKSITNALTRLGTFVLLLLPQTPIFSTHPSHSILFSHPFFLTPTPSAPPASHPRKTQPLQSRCSTLPLLPLEPLTRTRSLTPSLLSHPFSPSAPSRWTDSSSNSDLNFLGRLSHPNLVKLLGYCWEGKVRLLVYEYMQRGSLENHLFRRNPNIELLSWDIRLKIAIGAARGLAFLHTSEKKTMNNDFMASNILLDGNYNAKISDFGLARLGPSGGDSHVTWIATGHLYVKRDVYCFGVVLLEILTGLRALDTKRPTGQQNLVEWLKPSLSNKRKLKTIVDTRMEGQYSSKAVLQAEKLALKCLASDRKGRPSMEEVAAALECIEAIKGKPKKYKLCGNCFRPLR